MASRTLIFTCICAQIGGIFNHNHSPHGSESDIPPIKITLSCRFIDGVDNYCVELEEKPWLCCDTVCNSESKPAYRPLKLSNENYNNWTNVQPERCNEKMPTASSVIPPTEPLEDGTEETTSELAEEEGEGLAGIIEMVGGTTVESPLSDNSAANDAEATTPTGIEENSEPASSDADVEATSNMGESEQTTEDYGKMEEEAVEATKSPKFSMFTISKRNRTSHASEIGVDNQTTTEEEYATTEKEEATADYGKMEAAAKSHAKRNRTNNDSNAGFVNKLTPTEDYLKMEEDDTAHATKSRQFSAFTTSRSNRHSNMGESEQTTADDGNTEEMEAATPSYAKMEEEVRAAIKSRKFSVFTISKRKRKGENKRTTTEDYVKTEEDEAANTDLNKMEEEAEAAMKLHKFSVFTITKSNRTAKNEQRKKKKRKRVKKTKRLKKNKNKKKGKESSGTRAKQGTDSETKKRNSNGQ